MRHQRAGPRPPLILVRQGPYTVEQEVAVLRHFFVSLFPLLIPTMALVACANRHLSTMNHAAAQRQVLFCFRDNKPYSEGAYLVQSDKTRDAQTDKLLRCNDGKWKLESETKYCAISGLIYSQGAIAKKGEQWMRCDKGEWQIASLK